MKSLIRIPIVALLFSAVILTNATRLAGNPVGDFTNYYARLIDLNGIVYRNVTVRGSGQSNCVYLMHSQGKTLIYLQYLPDNILSDLGLACNVARRPTSHERNRTQELLRTELRCENERLATEKFEMALAKRHINERLAAEQLEKSSKIILEQLRKDQSLSDYVFVIPCVWFPVLVFLFALAARIIFSITEYIKCARMSPSELKDYKLKLSYGTVIPDLSYGTVIPKLICPHCQVGGQVRLKRSEQKKGISRVKATAAVLTAGISLIATGISGKESCTQAHCDNCGSTWII